MEPEPEHATTTTKTTTKRPLCVLRHQLCRHPMHDPVRFPGADAPQGKFFLTECTECNELVEKEQRELAWQARNKTHYWCPNNKSWYPYTADHPAPEPPKPKFDPYRTGDY